MVPELARGIENASRRSNDAQIHTPTMDRDWSTSSGWRLAKFRNVHTEINGLVTGVGTWLGVCTARAR